MTVTNHLSTTDFRLFNCGMPNTKLLLTGELCHTVPEFRSPGPLLHNHQHCQPHLPHQILKLLFNLSDK